MFGEKNSHITNPLFNLSTGVSLIYNRKEQPKEKTFCQ